MTETENAPLLRIRGLTIEFPTRHGTVRAVDGVDLDVAPQEVLGLVGESGSGKTMTALATLGLLPVSARVAGGSVSLRGRDLLGLSRREMRRIRGDAIGAVFQDPLTSLHPSFTVMSQLVEAVVVHRPGTSRDEAERRVVALLDLVGIPDAARRSRQCPHQWSGGMRQRAMVAMAIVNGPSLVIADEPTSALDVTVQAQILDVLRTVRHETDSAVLLITHDLGVVAELCDRVAVMQAGRIVETAAVDELFRAPRHDYTQRLLAAVPRLDAPVRRRPAGSQPHPPALHVEGLVTHFGRGARRVRAVDGVSLRVEPGETLGLVGESGCGKSTLARSIVRLIEPTAGRVAVHGASVTEASGAALQALRRQMQIVFQDPFASLNPRRRVGDSVGLPLRVHRLFDRAGAARRIEALFQMVGLDHSLSRRYPHELSGGQRQRVGLARALALEPRVLILDEPVSSLDVSTRAQILDLLARLQDELGLAYLFISHDLAVVRRLAHRVAVMYLGEIVETGPVDVLYDAPTHPYTQALLSSVPVNTPSGRGGGGRIVLRGDLPDAADPPSGCRFHTRCWKAVERCAVDAPVLVPQPSGPDSACHYASPVASSRDGGCNA